MQFILNIDFAIIAFKNGMTLENNLLLKGAPPQMIGKKFENKNEILIAKSFQRALLVLFKVVPKIGSF